MWNEGGTNRPVGPKRFEEGEVQEEDEEEKEEWEVEEGEEEELKQHDEEEHDEEEHVPAAGTSAWQWPPSLSRSCRNTVGLRPVPDAPAARERVPAGREDLVML